MLWKMVYSVISFSTLFTSIFVDCFIAHLIFYMVFELRLSLKFFAALLTNDFLLTIGLVRASGFQVPVDIWSVWKGLSAIRTSKSSVFFIGIALKFTRVGTLLLMSGSFLAVIKRFIAAYVSTYVLWHSSAVCVTWSYMGEYEWVIVMIIAINLNRTFEIRQ